MLVKAFSLFLAIRSLFLCSFAAAQDMNKDTVIGNELSKLKGNFRPQSLLIHDTIRLNYPYTVELSAPSTNRTAVSGCNKTQDGAPGRIDTPARAIRICGCHGSIDKQPLYFVDGIPVENSQLNLLNPDDIKSIDIVKDEKATKIYGSRAVNGVVLIYTKRNFLKRMKGLLRQPRKQELKLSSALLK